MNICVLIVMFLTAGAVAKPADDDKMMKQLIAQRIEILEQYYRSEAEFDQSRSDLEKSGSRRTAEDGCEIHEGIRGYRARSDFGFSNQDKIMPAHSIRDR